MSNLGHQPSLRSDQTHAVIIHGGMLTTGKRAVQDELLTHRTHGSRYANPMEIGLRIKRARELAGLSQTELAKVVGVTRGLVGQWESHRKKPGRDNLAAIAEATSVSAAYLLGQAEIDQVAVIAKPGDEAALLRKYRVLGRLQQKNLLQLLDISADIRREIEQERGPAHSEDIV